MRKVLLIGTIAMALVVLAVGQASMRAAAEMDITAVLLSPNPGLQAESLVLAGVVVVLRFVTLFVVWPGLLAGLASYGVGEIRARLSPAPSSARGARAPRP